MAISIPIEPDEVLALPPEATLDQIRNAYREKAKRHHPDAGGDNWAFRIVTQSYEWLINRRMSRRLREEETREEQRAHHPSPEPTPHHAHEPSPEEPPVRRALRDSVPDPARLVDVEIFTIRYEVCDPTQLLYARPEDLTLACSLNVVWPSRELPTDSQPTPRTVPPPIDRAFRALVRKTRAKSSHILPQPDQFSAWVSYPTLTAASEACEAFREQLHQQGYGVAQWMRDVTIPKHARHEPPPRS